MCVCFPVSLGCLLARPKHISFSLYLAVSQVPNRTSSQPQEPHHRCRLRSVFISLRLVVLLLLLPLCCATSVLLMPLLPPTAQVPSLSLCFLCCCLCFCILHAVCVQNLHLGLANPRGVCGKTPKCLFAISNVFTCTNG